jgi:hypothetical protein
MVHQAGRARIRPWRVSFPIILRARILFRPDPSKSPTRMKNEAADDRSASAINNRACNSRVAKVWTTCDCGHYFPAQEFTDHKITCKLPPFAFVACVSRSTPRAMYAPLNYLQVQVQLDWCVVRCTCCNVILSRVFVSARADDGHIHLHATSVHLLLV